MKFFLNAISWIVLAVAVILAILSFGKNAGLFQGYSWYVVQSGSMEPSIMIGDLVVVKKQDEYYKRDVVTFESSDTRKVTHRIDSLSGEGESQVFITKGDANRTEDNDTVTKNHIIGKVVYVIPKIGLANGFISSGPGLIIFIVIPALIIIGDEVFSLLHNGRKES
ncbi:MAG: signal peptidase I [bacterium]|nr:signal peptidase I [bacterium]